MSMQIGERIDIARRRQFAGEVAKLPEELVSHLRLHVQGDESDEFYAGLLSGLTAAMTLIQAQLGHIIPQATAVVADILEQREASL